MLKGLACVALIACGSGTAKPKPPIVAAPAQVDVLAHLPADTTAVVAVDVARLRKTPLWSKYKGKLETAAGPVFADLKTKCGFDPVEAITMVVAGTKTTLEDDAVIVVRGLDKAKTTACVLKQAVPYTTATADGEVITLHHQSGRMNMFTFVNDHTLVLRSSNSPTKELLRAATSAGSPLRDTTDFMADFNRVPPEAAGWFVVTGRSKLTDQLAAIGEKPLGIVASVKIGDAIVIDGRVRMSKPETAKSAANILGGALASFAMFGTATAKDAANDVVIALNLRPEILDVMLGTSSGNGGQDGGQDDPPPPPPPVEDPPNPCGD
jgi:hypothetical protein